MLDEVSIPSMVPSPLNFTGSKFLLMEQLRFHFSKDCKIFYDLFTGGGSVFVNVLDMFDEIYVNDIIPWLISFYKWLQSTDIEAVLAIIKSRNISKDSQQKYLELRERFNSSGDFLDFFILVSSCTNNMMRFNKSFKFNQTWGKRNFNSSTEVRLCRYSNRIYKNDRLHFINGNFDEIDIKDGSLVYLDPPYLITEAGYNAYWSLELERKLYDYLDRLNSRGIKFLMSNVRSHKGVENPYLYRLSRYSIFDINHNYTKVSRSGNPNTIEIIVKNY